MNPTRLPSNPIITTASHPTLGNNVNGPSLIRVPDWLPNPLGRYYLYFGHHGGEHIRLAIADRLEGPWRVHPPGVLPVSASHFAGHIASPDVHVDHEHQRIVMYFHGMLPREQRAPLASAELNDPFYISQRTRAASSTDGLTFTARAEVLAAAYLRVWRWRGVFYGMAMPGLLYRSADWFGPFERGPIILQTKEEAQAALRAGVGMVRHAAVRLVPATKPHSTDTLEIYYSRTGDAPERILMSTVDLHDDWSRWRASGPMEVIRPELHWEGADCEHTASTRGAVSGRAWQLRDPAVFEDDGQTCLLYSIAGEQGLAIARLS